MNTLKSSIELNQFFIKIMLDFIKIRLLGGFFPVGKMLICLFAYFRRSKALCNMAAVLALSKSNKSSISAGCAVSFVF